MELLATSLVTLFKAVFMFYCSWACYSYYSGKGGLDREKEKIRKNRVEKMGWLIIALSSVSFMLGAYLSLFVLGGIWGAIMQ